MLLIGKSRSTGSFPFALLDMCEGPVYTTSSHVIFAGSKSSMSPAEIQPFSRVTRGDAGSCGESCRFWREDLMLVDLDLKSVVWLFLIVKGRGIWDGVLSFIGSGEERGCPMAASNDAMTCSIISGEEGIISVEVGSSGSVMLHISWEMSSPPYIASETTAFLAG